MAGRKGTLLSVTLGILVVSAIIYGLSATGYTFLNRQITTNTVENHMCYSAEEGADVPDFCDTEGVKFTKFIWFVTDGFPAKSSEGLFEAYPDHSIIYHVKIPGAKYSHAIYTSWLTGQLPTNYNGKPIVGDNLLASMKRSKTTDYNLHYSGPEWSFLAITGSDNYDAYFDDIDIHYESIEVHYQHAYPFFFETAEERRVFEWEFMPELKRKNKSLIAHSAIFDHAQHGVFRGHGDARQLNPWARTITKDMKWMKSFIDSNPDYLLIMSSDHGVDEYNMSGYVLHGSSENGNNGYMMLYNPRLPQGQHVQGIDIVDVCPTMAQHLEGVDIPMNSLGAVRTYTGSSSPTQFSNMVKQNLKQLEENVKLRGLPIETTQVEELLSLQVRANEHVTQLQTYANTLKQRLYNTVIAPWELVGLYGGVSLALYVLSYMSLNRTKSQQGWFEPISWFFVAMFPVTINLLVAWGAFGRIFKTGSTFFLGTPLLAISVLYNLSLLHHQHRGVVKVAIARLFRNECINWTVLTVTICLKENWKLAVRNTPYNWAITYVIGFFVLRKAVSTYEGQQLSSRRTVSGSETSLSPRDGQEKATRSSSAFSWSPIALYILCFAFECTEGVTELYFAASFHVLYAVIIFGGALYILFLLVKGELGPGVILMAANTLLWVLWMDTSSARLLLLLINYQYLHLLCPLLQILDGLTYTVTPAQLQVEEKEEAGAVVVDRTYQLALVYFINQMYCHFSVALSDRINLSVQPFAGTIGVSGFDVYPVLSGFFMGYHKYGWFAVMGFYAWYSASRSSHVARTKMNAYSSALLSWVLPDNESRRRLEFACSFLLYFVNAQLGFALVLCFFGTGQALEEVVVFCALTGLIAVGFAVVCLLRSVGSLLYGEPEVQVNLHND